MDHGFFFHSYHNYHYWKDPCNWKTKLPNPTSYVDDSWWDPRHTFIGVRKISHGDIKKEYLAWTMKVYDEHEIVNNDVRFLGHT